MVAKLKEFVKRYHSELILGIAVIAVTIISFNVGRLSVHSQTATVPLRLIPPGHSSGETADSNSSGFTAQSTAKPVPRDPTVVASKAAGSKLYHFTWCSGAKRIAEKNKISWPNEAAAIAAGYSLAGNCQR